jgi:hypothetical protein
MIRPFARGEIRRSWGAVACLVTLLSSCAPHPRRAAGPAPLPPAVAHSRPRALTPQPRGAPHASIERNPLKRRPTPRPHAVDDALEIESGGAKEYRVAVDAPSALFVKVLFHCRQVDRITVELQPAGRDGAPRATAGRPLQDGLGAIWVRETIDDAGAAGGAWTVRVKNGSDDRVPVEVGVTVMPFAERS